MKNNFYLTLVRQIVSLIFLLFLIYLFPLTLASQDCPFGIENCKGGCGRWIDNNGDGFCDKGLKSLVLGDTLRRSSDSTLQENLTVNTENINQSTSENKNPLSETKETQITEKLKQISFSNYERYGLHAFSARTRHTYNLILYSSLTTGCYFLSLLMLYLKIFTKKTHRRIWNVLLLLTFLVSGLLGLMLVVQINYRILASWYIKFLHWHVDFGIAMALISIFHIIWHFSYFRNIFRKTTTKREQA